MQQNEMHKQRTDVFEEFMDVTLLLSEEELQALHGMIPMTQEIFERCVQKCEDMGAVRQLRELLDDFPELYQSYRKSQERKEKEQKERREKGREVSGQECESSGKTSGEDLQTDPLWQRINSQLEKMKRS